MPLEPIPAAWLPAAPADRPLRLAGLDEVGRGSLAGPLVAAAVVLPPDLPVHPDLRDSKRLDPKGRRIVEIARWVVTNAEVLIEEIPAAEIDRIGIGRANRLVFERLLERAAADLGLVDGTLRLATDRAHRSEPRAERFAPVAAASVVAKVYRDALMRAADELFPGYAFASSAGYGGPAIAGLLAQGRPSPIHRRSFRVRALGPDA